METLRLVKLLEKPSLNHDEAIQLSEVIQGKSDSNTKDIQWIKWILGISLPLLVAGMLFLYTRMDRLETKMDDRINRLEIRLNEKIDNNQKELNKKIDGLKKLIIQGIKR